MVNIRCARREGGAAIGRHKVAKNVEILPWLSGRVDRKEGRFIQVGNSLVLSKRFQTLSAGARWLYFAMAMEAGGRQELTFTHGSGKKYGVPPSSYDRQISELKEKGFIESANDLSMAQYAPCTYRFIFDWKTGTSFD